MFSNVFPVRLFLFTSGFWWNNIILTNRYIVLRNHCTMKQWLHRRKINDLKLHMTVCAHINSWNMLSIYLKANSYTLGLICSIFHFFFILILIGRILYLIFLNGECVYYRKPELRGKLALPSYNTPPEPFQSWSTHITRNNRMILWTQITREWFSPEKLSLNNGLSRKCIILLNSLVIFFLYNVYLCRLWV